MVVDAQSSPAEVSAASARNFGFSELIGADGPAKVVAVTTEPGAFVRVVCGSADPVQNPCEYAISLATDVVNASSGRSAEVEAGETIRVLGTGAPARGDVCLGDAGAEVSVGAGTFAVPGGAGSSPAEFLAFLGVSGESA